MDPRRKPWWRPEYRTDGPKPRTYTVDIQSAECPVSLITPEIRALIALEANNRKMKEATGATMFGPDASLWPAWFSDLVVTIEIQRVEEHNARAHAQASQ